MAGRRAQHRPDSGPPTQPLAARAAEPSVPSRAGTCVDPSHDGRRDLDPDLEPSERLLVVLRGIGAVMFLTSQRIIVARDGGERRPRSGVSGYALASIRALRLELGSPPSGRIAITTGLRQEAVSMFFDARSLARAQELIDVARPLIARQRRAEGRPVRAPNGPAASGSIDPT